MKYIVLAVQTDIIETPETTNTAPEPPELITLAALVGKTDVVPP